MKLKWKVALSAVVVLTLIGGSVYAAGSIKLVVNGKTVATDTAPQVINGHVLVPIRAAAEALGAKVDWNSSSRSVTIDTSGQAPQDDMQVKLLQAALAPATADEAVNTWAESVKSRNGAAQYAVLSEALRKKTKSAYEEANWVTGLSSPWVDSFDVSDGVKGDDGRTVYDVKFELKTSAGDAGSGTIKVTVGTDDEDYMITGLAASGDSDDLDGIVVLP